MCGNFIFGGGCRCVVELQRYLAGFQWARYYGNAPWRCPWQIWLINPHTRLGHWNHCPRLARLWFGTSFFVNLLNKYYAVFLEYCCPFYTPLDPSHHPVRPSKCSVVCPEDARSPRAGPETFPSHPRSRPRNLLGWFVWITVYNFEPKGVAVGLGFCQQRVKGRVWGIRAGKSGALLELADGVKYGVTCMGFACSISDRRAYGKAHTNDGQVELQCFCLPCQLIQLGAVRSDFFNVRVCC